MNTTGITAAFSGSVNILAVGTVSIDGGASTIPINLTGNQQITDSFDGTVIHLNTTDVRRAGTDTTAFAGTSSAFTSLIGLREELLTGSSRSSADHRAAMEQRLTEIERVEDHLLDEISTQSVSLENLDRLETRTEDLQLHQIATHAETSDADLAAAALELQELQQFLS